MKPSDYYQDLISSITEDDVKRVAYQMTLHVGSDNMVDINQLAYRVYGKVNTSTVRKTREIIERLVKEHGMPIGAYSGKAGRFLIRDESERSLVTAELGSRIRELSDRMRAIQTAALPGAEPVQKSLF